MAEKIDLASISYMLGVISIVLAFFEPFAGLAFGIIGFIQARKAKSQKARRLNIIGIVLSAILIIISIVAFIYALNNGLGTFPSI
jgi:uncharacterized membrane protein